MTNAHCVPSARRFFRPAGAGAALALAAMLGPTVSRAQDGTSPLAGLMRRSEFGVPDAPAMKLLSVGDGAILRPQSFGNLSLGLSGFRGAQGQFVVPTEFGLEFSPTLLSARSDATFKPTNAFLAQSRLSLAARRDSGGRNAIAVGFRYAVSDDADFSGDSDALDEFKQRVNGLTDSINVLMAAARRRVGPSKPLVLTTGEDKAVGELQDRIRELLAADQWNANALHLAVAARATTADTLGNDPKLDELAAWGTVARRLGSSSQFLIGVQAGSARDTLGEFRSTLSVSTRLYYGSNAGKVFLEGTMAMRAEAAATNFLVAGLELRLANIGWIDAAWGVEQGDDGPARTYSSVKLKRTFGWP